MMYPTLSRHQYFLCISASQVSFYSAESMETEGDATAKEQSALIFLGTGCSSMVPSTMCLIRPTPDGNSLCKVCSQSLVLPPEQNPNYRCNASLLIDFCQSNGEHSYILIDVGKTFREQVLRWFTYYNIRRIDSIILTHEHADAVHGLDDLQHFQSFGPTNDAGTIPIYASQFCMESVANKFPYLVPWKHRNEEEMRQITRFKWEIIESDCKKLFVVSGLQFVPLPVMHGEDYISLGFLFGKKHKVAYVSDVSRFPLTTEDAISCSGGGQVDLLILDANTPNMITSPSTHYCLPQSLDAVKRISPKQALLIGMNHDFDHHIINASLMEWSGREGIPVQLAYDGMRIPLDL